MNLCPWEPIHGFQSASEFHRFDRWMASQIETGAAEPVEVVDAYRLAGSLNERWFRHRESMTLWRLVSPDAPFAGLFEVVEAPQKGA